MAEPTLPAWSAEVLGRRLVQPDQRSCGATALVVAHLLTHPSYAGRVATAADFRAEVLAMHRRVTGSVDVAGRLQLPWPRAIGTPPWAVARQLEGSTGLDHEVRLTGPDRGAAYDRILAATAAGHPVPVYVGSAWLPRHVVLAVAPVGTGLAVHEPSSGRLAVVTRELFVAERLGLAGWDRPWFSVAPRARRSPA